MWEHFHHEADIGVRGIAPTLALAFEEAALALTAVITSPETVLCRDSIDVDCEAPAPDLLLVDWLNALVFEMATRRMLFSRFHVAIEGTRLHASACGEPVDVARHQPAAEVKGATFTQLAVCEDAPGRWRVQCVVDV